jgi:polar amino acid transport system substrate-binding protein
MNTFKNLLIIFIISFSFTPSLNAKTIIIAADKWCPYNCDPESEFPGYMVEIVIESFKLYGNGEKIVYRTMPWSRAMIEGRAGRVGGIIGAIDSESVGLHMPDNELGVTSASFFTHNDSNWNFDSFDKMSKSSLTVGTMKGYEWGEETTTFINNNQKKITFSYGVDGLPKLIKVLKTKRIEILLEDQAVFWFMVKRLKLPKDIFRFAGTVGVPKKLYVSFHNKKHAEIVSKGIEALRNNGKLNKILKKYNLKDWRK